MKRLGWSLLVLAVVAGLIFPKTGSAFPYFIDFTVKGDRPGEPTDPVNGGLTSYGFFSFDSSLIPPGGGDRWGEVRIAAWGTEILGLGATSLQFTWDSHTWTRVDADLFRLYFSADGNCLAWSIGGGTVGLNHLSGGTYPDFWVSAPGIDFKYTTANSWRIFDGTITSWGLSLGARAFVESSARTVPVGPDGPDLRVWIEPRDGAFQISNVDPSSIELSSPPLGSESIRAISSKPSLVSDRDHNGVADLGIRFGGGDLYHLLGNFVGRRTLHMVLRGHLIDGSNLRAEIDFNVVGVGPTVQATVSPNPLNPTGILTFETRRAGAARVQIFSANGRLVQTLLDVSNLPSGQHKIRLGSTDGRGRPLATGVYYYRVRADGNETCGRIAVLK